MVRVLWRARKKLSYIAPLTAVVVFAPELSGEWHILHQRVQHLMQNVPGGIEFLLCHWSAGTLKCLCRQGFK